MNCNIYICDCNKSVVACCISDPMYPATTMFSNLDENPTLSVNLSTSQLRSAMMQLRETVSLIEKYEFINF